MTKLPPGLRDELIYLAEIGYGELYLPASAPGARETEASHRTGVSRHRPPVPREAPPKPPQDAAGPDSTRSTGADHSPDPARATAATPGAAERAAALAEVAREAEGCDRCRLWQGRNRVVFGTGDSNADLMFVGEGPGAEEDRQGLPFVGAAGDLLTKIIEAIGLRRQDVYIANVVKCRPPGNRDPLPDEASACRSYLDRQIDLVRPRVIVALGRVAAQALLGNDLPLGRMRGRWFTVRGVPAMVTYHPAALLRNRAWKRPTWEDMQAVQKRLAEG